MGENGIPPAARLTDSVVIPANAKLIFRAERFLNSIRKSFLRFLRMLFKIYSPGAEIYIVRFISGNNQDFVIFYFINYFIKDVAALCVKVGTGLVEH